MAWVPKSEGGVLSYFTRHKTIANLMMIIMVVLGIVAATNIRSQFFPDVVIDNVTVSVSWQGAGPEDVDNGIIQLLEPVLLAVEGVETTNSVAREGTARIILEFEPGWDMARAADDVKSATDSVTDLPEDAEDAVVRRGVWRDRVTDVVISGPVATDQLARFADELVANLFRAGITRTTIRGVQAPETIVEVPEASLIRHDISLRQIADAIGEEAEADPAGDVAGGTARIRTGVAKRSANDVASIVVRSNADGSKLLVGDVATLRIEGVARQRSYFVGNNPAISIRVDRSNQGDAIAMQAVVENLADQLQQTLPDGVTVELTRTRAEAISDRLNILFRNGALGLVLVVSLLFLFLNARTAFWVAAGIPVAMSAAIALMFVAGLTINMVSLFALIITLGIVVDDAIVVGEHADFRARRLKEPPTVAAENAARRMAAPVFSATITTVIAFFGLIVIGGRFGSLIVDIPFTVIVVLLASLFEVFLILPHHMSQALKAAQKRHWYDLPSHYFNIGFSWVRDNLFRRAMGFVVLFRYPVMALVILALASQVNLFIRGDVIWRFFNAPERGSITGNFAMVPGAERADTLAMMKELQRATQVLGKKYEAEYGTNPLDYVLAQVGGSGGRGLSGAASKEKDLLGAVSIDLIDADLRPAYSSFDFLGELQESVKRHPLLETLSFRGHRSGPGGDAIDVQLFGASSEDLKAAAEALKSELAQSSEVSSLEDDLAYDKEELILDLTPQGQALGFTIDTLGRVLRNRLNGITAASYPLGGRSADITVQLPDGAMTADFLDRTMMRTPEGKYVSLADIVTVTSKAGFATVIRENGLRVISVTGDVSEDNPKRAEEIMNTLTDVILPKIEQDFGVSHLMAGQSEQEKSFLKDAQTGFMLSLMGIYLVLAWIFSSWTRPVVVMAVIPFGLVGTIYGHNAWDVPLSMFSVVGMIGMTGIIINDSIVLVGTIDEYAEDRDLRTAILDGVTDRLRPVLLTTLTTVLGLAPLLFETSRQAQFLKPTVITLSYGLGFGLVLVLLVVPSLIAMQMDISRRMASARRMLTGRQAVAGHRIVFWLAVIGSASVFAATVGYFSVKQTLYPPIAEVTSALGRLPDALTALVSMGIGVTLVCVAALVASAVLMRVSKRQTAPTT